MNVTSGGSWGAVVAGWSNSDSGNSSVVAGGYKGVVTGDESFLGAGYLNSLSGQFSFIGSGESNTVSSPNSFTGGGAYNMISSETGYSAILGGYQNAIAGAGYATIGGGLGNSADGKYATVPGGYRNEASGELSFAAGYDAHALNNGSFVWSDYVSGSSPVSDTAADQFIVRASGGTYVYSNEGATSGVELLPGSGSWSSLSDRNAKTAIEPIDGSDVLNKLRALPISTWSYKSERGVRHLGPMSEDFYSTFGVGEDDRHIATIDEDGVALAAIQELSFENRRLRARVALLEQKDFTQSKVVDARLSALEAHVALRARHKP